MFDFFSEIPAYKEATQRKLFPEAARLSFENCNPLCRRTFYCKIFFASHHLLLSISKGENDFEEMVFGEKDSCPCEQQSLMQGQQPF